MIIYLNNEGRLGHHISLLVTLLAYSIKYNRPIYYDSFEKKYAHYFQESEYAVKISFWLVLFSKLIYKTLKLLRINKFYIYNFYFLLYTDKNNEILFNKDIENIFTHKKLFIITDYMLNDVVSVNHYAHIIRDSMLLKPFYEKEIINSFKEIRNKKSTIIAIHIRKTDFKEFSGGKFYFEEKSYRKVIDNFIKIKKLEVTTTEIFICSDEYIDITIFKNYNIHYQQRSFIEDFCILKNADYIISTKSIFSFSANFMGNNYIYQFTNPNKEIAIENILSSSKLMHKYNLKQNNFLNN